MSQQRNSDEKMVRVKCTPQFIDRMTNFGGLDQVFKCLPAHAEDSFKIELHNDSAKRGEILNMEGALKVLESFLTDKSLINSPEVIRDKSYEKKK